MSNTLKVATLQLNIAWGDIDANIARAESLLNSLPEGYDIAILPEMFTTGFIVERDLALRCAETVNGRTLQIMRQWAKKFNLAIIGSIIVNEGEHLKNRAYFVEPSGEVCYYDKHHLFEISGENLIYAPGNNQLHTVRFRGWNIAFAICFDLRFPAWLRNNKGAYDLLIIVANWPDSRKYAWQQLLIARAIENQAYVIGANRTGSDQYGEYTGSSIIVDPKGLTVEEGLDNYILSATLDKNKLLAFRNKFPVYLLNDSITIN